MFLLHITALLGVALLLGYRWKEEYADIMPIVFCGMILSLYGLAFARHMSWIDFGMVGINLLLVGILLANYKKESFQFFLEYAKKQVFSGAFLYTILMPCFAIWIAKGKIVTWWDDLNFWAADLKALTYLDGFANRYANVAPEFGDYPPGTQFAKWWVLHLFGGGFHEGRAFVGYYIFLFLLVLPLMKRFTGKKSFLAIVFIPLMWLLPGVAEIYGYEGFCADLVMAFLYGAFLYAVVDREGHKDAFYYARATIYLMILVLCKSTGFVWAAFGIVFFFLCQIVPLKKAKQAGRLKRELLKSAMVVGLPILTGASWMLFCLKMHRVTKTTSTAITYLTTDQYGISGYTSDFAKAFLQAFFGEPLHKNHTGLLNLTPILFLILTIVVVIVVYKLKLFPKECKKICLWFPIVSGVLFYVVIFIAHITIFANETQYLEATGMISSIERYGAPFTVGMVLFLGMLCVNHVQKTNWVPVLFLVVFVLGTTDYSAAYHGAIGYRKDLERERTYRQGMVQGQDADFVNTIQEKIGNRSVRVFGLYSDDGYQKMRNTYIAYEASPVSTMYGTLLYCEEPDLSIIIQSIAETHSEYLYVFQGEKDLKGILDEVVPDKNFQYNTIYKVAFENGTMVLYAL